MVNREAERKRLVEQIKESLNKHIGKSCLLAENIASDLLDNGIVVPTVKVGDVVYALWETPTLYTEAKYVLYSAEVKEVCHCKRNNRLVLMYKLEPTSFRGRIREFSEYDFGRIFFTSREEAKKALKEDKNGED